MAASFVVTIYLQTPATAGMNGGLGLLLTPYVTQETSSTLTTAIERGDGINEFVVPDISIKGRDRTSTIQGYLKQITPTSSNFFIYVKQEFNAADEGYSVIYPYMMILPNTLVFDEVEKSFAFTAVHIGRNAAITDASTLFQNRQRTVTSGGYTVPRWKLNSTAEPTTDIIEVFDVLQAAQCDLYAGDTISIGFPDSGSPSVDFDVRTVSNTATAYVYSLRLSAKPGEAIAANTYISLLTPYDRNVTLQSMVTTLFGAVPQTNGLAPGGFNASTIAGQTTLYSSPLTIAGLNGTILGICPFIDPVNPGTFGRSALMSTTTGIYELQNVAGPWTTYSAFTMSEPVLDPTNYRTVLGIWGKKRSFEILSSKYGLNAVMSFYGYWFNYNSSNFIRYRLEITCDGDTNNGLPPYPFTVKLYQQTCTNARDWGSETIVDSLVTAKTTADDLTELYDCFGLDVDPLTGVVVFTDLDVASNGDPATFQMSVYVPGVGTTRARMAGRGIPVVTDGSASHFSFFYDGFLGQAPQIYGINVDSAGNFTIRAQNPNVPGMLPRTFRWNAGDNKFYGLYANSTGLWMRTFENENGFRTTTTRADVWVSESSGEVLSGAMEADLIVWRLPGRVGRYPLIALNGNVPFFVDNSFSGAVAYADMEGLSIGDALQQLSILVGAYVYYDRNAYGYFRTRSVSSSIWIGGSQGASQLDDSRAVTIRAQSIWAKTTLYVRVENDNNKDIYGEAGDLRYRDDESLALKLSCRYVPTSAYAQAVASGLLQYLGSQKRWVEIQHRIDGRDYTTGALFTATIDGMSRIFQIIETQQPVFSKLIKVVGVEL